MFGRQKKLPVSCPSCGHDQEEAMMARSTFCRGCGSHIQIVDGVPVPPQEPAPFPFPSREELERQEVENNVESSPRARLPKRTQPPRETQLEFFAGWQLRRRHSSALASKARIPRVATTTGDHPAIARLARLLPEDPKEGHRHVHCLDCDFPQSIPLSAVSTMCPRCSEPIPLEDYEIREMYHRRIRTRGNVHIYRKGSINGVTVHCNNLIIEGEFTGSGIDCDGDLTLMRTGTIDGPVRCRRLIVRDRAEIVFTQPVHAQDVFIDGAVKGDIVCEKKLHLEKKSTLDGDIQTRSLSVSEGARHSGMVSMPQLAERYAKFGDLADIEGMELPGKSDNADPESEFEAEPDSSTDSGTRDHRAAGTESATPAPAASEAA